MEIVIVEICQGSLITAIDMEKLFETEYPEVAVIENDCLSFCGMCSRRPYALCEWKTDFC